MVRNNEEIKDLFNTVKSIQEFYRLIHNETIKDCVDLIEDINTQALDEVNAYNFIEAIEKLKL